MGLEVGYWRLGRDLGRKEFYRGVIREDVGYEGGRIERGRGGGSGERRVVGCKWEGE